MPIIKSMKTVLMPLLIAYLLLSPLTATVCDGRGNSGVYMIDNGGFECQSDGWMPLWMRERPIGNIASLLYYTLDEIVEFDHRGLWFYDYTRFSQRGSLLNTVEYFVTLSAMGYTVNELDEEFQVETQEPLLRLVKCGRIVRDRFGGLYLYCSRDQVVRQRQREIRSQFKKEPPGMAVRGEKIALQSDEIKAAIVLFFSTLDEKQRCLYAGLESIKFGHGGDRRIAELLGLDAHTIAKGRGEVVEQDIEWDRIRRAGGGRPPVKKNSRSNSGY